MAKGDLFVSSLGRTQFRNAGLEKKRERGNEPEHWFMFPEEEKQGGGWGRLLEHASFSNFGLIVFIKKTSGWFQVLVIPHGAKESVALQKVDG